MQIPFFKRKKAIFEFSFVENMNLERVGSAAALINWVVQENARLLEDDTDGSVLVVKRNGKGTILFAKYLELPLYTETDFDELLYDFYTKKPLPFDQNILNGPEVKQGVNYPEYKKSDTVSLEDKGYAQVPIISEESLEEHSEEMNETSSVETGTYDHDAIVNEQVAEIYRLRAELAEKSNQSVNMLDQRFVSNNYSQIIKIADNELLEKESTLDLAGSNLIVEQEVIETKVSFSAKSFEQRLTAFIEQELKNIEDEIKLVDKRGMIEGSVKETIRQEEDKMLKLIEKTISEQKAEAVQAEEHRHLAELENIEQKYEQELKQQRIQTINDYQNEEKERISREFNRQTQELKEIIEIRMVTLRERQERLGGGLSKKFDSVLHSIQDVGSMTTQEIDCSEKQTKDSRLKETEKRKHA